MKTLADFALRGLRVLLREDLNVPLTPGGALANDARLRAALPTVRDCLERGAAVLLMSHLGRPTEGALPAAEPEFSLAPVRAWLEEHLGQPVALVQDWLGGVDCAPGSCVLLENTRFLVGEKAAADELGRRLAKLCDLFVMDAFAVAHRAQASTAAVARHAPAACIGPLMERELAALSRVLRNPERPLVAIVGGAKVSTKAAVLENLLAAPVDSLILGGGIANTFLAAAGKAVGSSLHEPGWLDRARVLGRSEAIEMPLDVVVAPALDAGSEARVASVDEVAPGEAIFDLGPRSLERLASLVASAGTIVWSGPLGAFEHEGFSQGTRALAEAVAASAAFSAVGGGDTLAAIERFADAGSISYVSTGGGAFLEYIAGHSLPALEALSGK